MTQFAKRRARSLSTGALMLIIASFAMFSAGKAFAQPYGGTIFIDPDIIVPSDPTVFQSATYAGRGQRQVYDRRVERFITINAYLFNIRYSDGLTTEAQINPEFGAQAANAEAQKYGSITGRLPYVLRTRVASLWIHKGVELFGGGNNSLLIHTGQTELYERDGILEETLMHEASHTSLDPIHAAAQGWLAAQQSDNGFISTYARDNPTREDIAESFLPYYAVRFKADRISTRDFDLIRSTIPARIRYFDTQVRIEPSCRAPQASIPRRTSNALGLQWNQASTGTYYLYYRLAPSGGWRLAVDGLTTARYTLRNLAPNTAYDIDLWSDCGNGQYFSTRLSSTTRP